MAQDSTYSSARTRRLERIIVISRILSSTRELEPLLQIIIETASELTQSEASSILLLDPTTGELRFEAAPWVQRDMLKTVSVPLDRSIAGWVFRNAKPLVISDAADDPRVYRQVDQAVDFKTRSILGVPLLIKERAIGVIEAVNKLGESHYTAEDVELLTTLAAQAAIAIENTRLLAALQTAYDELAKLDKMKSDFIAIASHELRTPLGLILGHATYLRETSGPEVQDQIDVVVRSALRLKSVMEDLSNLGHIEAGQVRIRPTQFQLDEVVREVIRDSLGLAQAKQLDVRAQFRPESMLINADRDKLRVILSNLLTNAVKFTPEGGHVLLTAQTMPGYVKVSVIDDGIGIPADQLERIFDRFFQVEGHLTRRHGGMGLGLSIAKVMVEMHRGQIWAESKIGGGSNFSFLIPDMPAETPAFIGEPAAGAAI